MLWLKLATVITGMSFLVPVSMVCCRTGLGHASASTMILSLLFLLSNPHDKGHFITLSYIFITTPFFKNAFVSTPFCSFITVIRFLVINVF